MGGTKHDGAKVRMDLLPPDFLFATAEVLTFGAKKYAEYNWAAGFDWSRVYGAAQRHLNAWWMGEDKDTETGLSHLAHASCCLAFLVTFERRKMGRDDRFIYPTTTNVCLPVQNVHEEESLSSKPPELPHELRTVQQFVSAINIYRAPYGIEVDERVPRTVRVRWTKVQPAQWFNVPMADALALITERSHSKDEPAPTTARSAQVVRVTAGLCDGCSQEPQSCRCPNEGQNSSAKPARRQDIAGRFAHDAPKREPVQFVTPNVADEQFNCGYPAAPTSHFHRSRREVEE